MNQRAVFIAAAFRIDQRGAGVDDAVDALLVEADIGDRESAQREIVFCRLG